MFTAVPVHMRNALFFFFGIWLSCVVWQILRQYNVRCIANEFLIFPLPLGSKRLWYYSFSIHLCRPTFVFYTVERFYVPLFSLFLTMCSRTEREPSKC